MLTNETVEVYSKNMLKTHVANWFFYSFTPWITGGCVVE